MRAENGLLFFAFKKDVPIVKPIMRLWMKSIAVMIIPDIGI
jgi:hypothetical protein